MAHVLVEEQNNLQAEKESMEELIDNGEDMNDEWGDTDTDWIYLSRFCFDIDQYDKEKDQERLDRFTDRADKESIEELIDNNGEEVNDGWGYTGPDWTYLSRYRFDRDHEERLDRYVQQVCDTAGFDVDTVPSIDQDDRIQPLLLYDHPPKTHSEYQSRRHSISIRQCAIRALELYNRRTGKNLHLVDVIKANLRRFNDGFRYWITFTAVDENKTRVPKTYQTQAFYKGYKECPTIDVYVFRPKPTNYY